MKSVQEKADEIFKTPEVIDALKTISKYGLGVLLVHAHNENGEFTDLPKGIVAYEENLQVSFRKDDQSAGEEFIPVAWIWDFDKGIPVAVMRCNNAQWCEER